MSISVNIPFNDPLQHTYDLTKIEVLGGVATLKSIVPASEICYFRFNVNGSFTSYRGAKTLVQGGAATATVASNKLNLTNSDTTMCSLLNQAGNVNGTIALRLDAITNFASIAANQDIFRIQSLTNFSRIRVYYQNNGGGVTRVSYQVLDSAGTSFEGILGLFTYSIGDSTSIAISRDATTLKFYLNGVMVISIACAQNFTNYDLNIGHTSTLANFSIDNLVLYSTNYFTAAFSVPVAELTDFSIAENTITTNIQLLMSKFLTYAAAYILGTNTQIGHYLTRNNVKYWHNGAAWVVSDGTLAQSNTAAQINTNAQTLYMFTGNGATVSISTILKSTDGWDNLVLEQIDLNYLYYFSPNTVQTCVVYGTITDLSGNPVVGATIKVTGKDFMYDNTLVTIDATVLSDANGNFSLEVVETTTYPSTVDIIVGYVEAGIAKEKKFKKLVIPNQASAKLSDL